MSAALLPEVRLGVDPFNEPQLSFATEGVQRYVWEGKFGAILIEVKQGSAYVNGQKVEPFASTHVPTK